MAIWVKNAQRKDSAPAFFEVVPLTEVKSSRKQSKAVGPDHAASTCRIRIGDTDIAIQLGYPADHLAEVLRAMRASQ
ncbi:hypothetical protein [Rhodobacter sp. 24-YEA-8]|uniref:hypothetical protein n=1 Tax=Rhodobacter sp. 24-YEA-8 TaxID=1884310 RepID=UPI000B87BD03|nr:hypothetical protein [Rhodobacter sp. 24-YEA-8]